LYLRTNHMGSFAGSVEVPEVAPLGLCSVALSVAPDEAGATRGETFYERFSVQEYRKPEYEVEARPELPAGQPWAIQGSPFKVVVKAHYYFGGPVKGARLVYSGAVSGQANRDQSGEA